MLFKPCYKEPTEASSYVSSCSHSLATRSSCHLKLATAYFRSSSRTNTMGHALIFKLNFSFWELFLIWTYIYFQETPSVIVTILLCPVHFILCPLKLAKCLFTCHLYNTRPLYYWSFSTCVYSALSCFTSFSVYIVKQNNIQPHVYMYLYNINVHVIMGWWIALVFEVIIIMHG